MSQLSRLIAELCPAGVTHKSLGEVGSFIRGNGLQKSDLADAGTPAIHYGQVHTHYGVWTRTTKSFTDPALASRLRRARHGDLVIATTSEDDAAVGKATAWLGDEEAAVSGDAYIYRHTLDPRYVAYFFQSRQFKNQKARFVSGTKVRRIAGSALEKIRIPVPPLEAQREIVRILDQLTELEGGLEVELATRRKLRLAIRDRLFTLGLRSSTSVKLGDITKQYVDPFDVEPTTSYQNLGVRWYGEGAFIRGSKLGAEIKARRLYRVKANQFIYNRMFVTEGSFGLVTPELSSGVVSNEFPVFDLDAARVIPEWLFLFFQDAQVVKRVANEAEGGTRSRRRWKEDRFENFTVDLPPLEFQRETVRAVVRCLELEDVLRTELAARRQQYEYYRDNIFELEEAAA